VVQARDKSGRAAIGRPQLGPWQFVLCFVRGLGLLVAGVALGLSYDQSITLVVGLILGVNAVALGALASVVARL
jgi:hypothetical protein